MACCGDVPTLETLAAASLLREHFPELKVRVINVVDPMKLQRTSRHAHGLGDTEFDVFFTTDEPVIFAYHGYPPLIHRLTYRRRNYQNLHVRGCHAQYRGGECLRMYALTNGHTAMMRNPAECAD